MRKTTKIELVQEHLLKEGKITTWDAIEKYGATRLSAIIFILRKEGMNIVTNNITGKDRFGNSCTYAEYVYIPDEHIPRID